MRKKTALRQAQEYGIDADLTHGALAPFVEQWQVALESEAGAAELALAVLALDPRQIPASSSFAPAGPAGR
jgi:hypothetical protein